jgi:hypothetical protein
MVCRNPAYFIASLDLVLNTKFQSKWKMSARKTKDHKWWRYFVCNDNAGFWSICWTTENISTEIQRCNYNIYVIFIKKFARLLHLFRLGGGGQKFLKVLNFLATLHISLGRNNIFGNITQFLLLNLLSDPSSYPTYILFIICPASIFLGGSCPSPLYAWIWPSIEIISLLFTIAMTCRSHLGVFPNLICIHMNSPLDEWFIRMMMHLHRYLPFVLNSVQCIQGFKFEFFSSISNEILAT